MAKTTAVTIRGVKASTVAMFEGTLGGAIGIIVALMFTLRTTLELSESTSSVLAGLTFGVATGAVSLLIVPFIYFGLGWVVGYLHGWIFNTIVASSGGIGLDVEQ